MGREPEQPGRHNASGWSEFNAAQAMAVGYIRMSAAGDEYKRELLARYFQPEREN